MANVTINLSSSTDAIEMNEKDIIHQEQFKEAKKWIDRGIQKVLSSKTTKHEHVHETITILGTRGSGKTTFLLSLKDYYKKDDNVMVLDIIDPTLIEEKGHVFLNIISIINELVQKKLDSNDGDPNHNEQTQFTDTSVRVKWNNQLLELSHGLPSMDDVGGTLKEADWQDPEYIMERGLRTVTSARNLAISFQNFVAMALNILNKKVFFLAFDDIDIDFKKGWPVLETIRKYLLTSKIITLLSGDLRLYSLSIRKQYWNNFGKGLLKNEADALGKLVYFNERITEMESQYMLKVIKPERRIHLTTLYEKIIQWKSQYPVVDSKIEVQVGSQNVEIESYYKDILSQFGIRNKYQSEAYSSFLLGLPLRTQIQFLSEFNLGFNNLSNVNVVDAFLSDLIEKNVNVNLINSSSYLLNVEILKLLIRENVLNEVYQLQPVTGDLSLNSSLLSLSLLSSLKINNTPYLIFDYFIKIGYVRNLLNILGYEEKGSRIDLAASPSIEGLCSHSGVYQNKVLRDIAGNMTAYLKGVLSNVNLWGGIIPLLGLGDPAKKKESVLENRIDVAFKNGSTTERVLAFIPLSISAYTTKNRTIPCYSVYTLLASIGEIIRKVEQDDLDRGLAELSEVRTYGIPEFKKKINERIESVSFFLNQDSAIDFKDNELKKLINEWVNQYKIKDFKVSPHLLGKISTRFFYALSSIENVEESISLGEMMHRRIISFMNAVLIEDVRESIEKIEGFNINNTNLSDDIFVTNLNASGGRETDLEFSQWLLSCPLLLLYLNLEPKLLGSIAIFLALDDSLAAFYSNKSIYHTLNKVTAKSNRRLKQDELSGNSTYDQIIQVLMQREIPFEWFEIIADKKRTRENNENIRAQVGDIFGGDRSSGKIRAFRNYLRKIGAKW